MNAHRAPGFVSGEILLPAENVNYETWSVIACDQFTSQRDYWDETERLTGDAPSTLRLTLPEIDLADAEDRTRRIFREMRRYLDGGVLLPGVRDGFVLTDRETTQGHRPGLIGLIDLEEYDFAADSRTLVRPTERTIPERVPPRAKIRAGACLELPHVMMLADDPEETLIEPLLAEKDSLRRLYGFSLMQGGGRIEGYAVEGAAAEQVVNALKRLHENCGGLLYAVGDGNHSLAAAKTCWQEIRAGLTDKERENHPARYAMAEVVNIHCPALVFEPIHRLVKHADIDGLVSHYQNRLRERKTAFRPGGDVRFLQGGVEVGFDVDGLPLAELQACLLDFAGKHPGTELDYIHGEADLRDLARGDCVGVLLRGMDKSELFRFVREQGVLPRKAFSMGEARDKRYYLEARKL